MGTCWTLLKKSFRKLATSSRSCCYGRDRSFVWAANLYGTLWCWSRHCTMARLLSSVKCQIPPNFNSIDQLQRLQSCGSFSASVNKHLKVNKHSHSTFKNVCLLIPAQLGVTMYNSDGMLHKVGLLGAAGLIEDWMEETRVLADPVALYKASISNGIRRW